MDPFAGWEQHQFCYVTTVGRRTGSSHRIEIWFVVFGGAAWLMTERNPEPHWVRNLRVQPRVTVELGPRSFPALAEVMEDLPTDASPRTMLAARYQPSWADEDLGPWARQALAVRLTPLVR